MASRETLVAQAAHFVDSANGAVVPPIQPSTTYARDAAYRLPSDVDYTRDGNPTYRVAEQVLADLEGGKDALLFASGMAAATAAIRAIARPGTRVVFPRAMYHGLRVWLAEWCPTWNVELVIVDMTDLAAVKTAIEGASTALVWIESPANPTWEISDIAAIAAVARVKGATVVVDSTVPTPVHAQPLAFGAHLVLHAATKALNGHSDVLAGALVTADNDERWQKIRALRHLEGAVLGPFEAWLLLRGMRTLFVRVKRSSETALALATFLESHPRVERVLYPGLASHPGHAIAARQMMDGFGGMLSILVRGSREDALAVAGRLKIFLCATSLGGVESLVEHRATIEGAGSLAPPNMLRLSIGLESFADLRDDLDAALHG